MVLRAMAGEASHQMSAATRVELGLVLGGQLSEDDIDRRLAELGIDVVAFTPKQARLASEGHRRYGRGHHRARLNLGDTFSYALARDTGFTLLCVGDDFRRTDLPVAP
nr:type II toxin-antitoxin system VapC family toxin [Propioniciclava soli]